jgi:hypothetical protein
MIRKSGQSAVVFLNGRIILNGRVMRRLGVWLALLGGLYLPAWGTESLLRVPTTSKLELLHLLRSGMDVAYVEREGQFVDVVADSGELALLKIWGYAPLTVVPDLRAEGAGKLGAAMGGFHTYAEVKAFLDSIAAARPDLVSPVFSIGLSLQGKKIWGKLQLAKSDKSVLVFFLEKSAERKNSLPSCRLWRPGRSTR